jgi:hypothetical protein
VVRELPLDQASVAVLVLLVALAQREVQELMVELVLVQEEVL